MQTDTQAGWTQCMHCAFTNPASRPSPKRFTTVSVRPLRSTRASYAAPSTTATSAVFPFASRHLVTQARHPTQRTASTSRPQSSGEAFRSTRASAASGTHAAAAPAAANVFSAVLLVTFAMSVLPLLLLGPREPPRRGVPRPGGRADDDPCDAGRDRRDVPPLCRKARIRHRCRRLLDRHRRVERNGERDALLGAPHARVADADRPRARDLAEGEERAVRVRLRPLAAELVEAPPVAVPLVAVDLREPPRVEVRPPRAVLVDHAAVREHRAALRVERGERAERRELEHRAEQVVGVRRAA